MKTAARAATAAAAAGLLAGAMWSAFHGHNGTGRFAARAAGTSTATTFQWQYTATGVDRVPDAVLRGSSSIQIAIIDTGADVTAPELAARQPVTWDLQTRRPDVSDANGHGTFVTSLAASIGDAKLLVIKAGRADGSFTSLDEARAIRYAVDHGARIVNLSLSGTTTSPAEKSAIAYAVKRGVLLVAAVGNEYKQGNPIEYPAALLQPVGSNGLNGIGLAVAASTRDGVRASFSNTGSWISVAAPGEGVFASLSQLSSPSKFPRTSLTGTAGLYGYGSGTSYAAPQVAAAAALVWSANPSLEARDVARILKETASGHGTWTPELGFGVIDVAAAVARALSL